MKVSKTSKINLDRLSFLPKPIIFHILSLLPTKDAARTSVLSTKWKQLFLYVPKIILDDVWVLSQTEKLEFTDFVNRRLLLSKAPSITEFRLKGNELTELASPINLWLNSLLSRNLQVVELEETRSAYSPDDPLCPPRELFASATLVVLKICGWNILLKIPQSVYFPKLEVLHLKNLYVQSHSDSLMFSKGAYPVIKDLRLENIGFHNNNKSQVSVGIVLHSHSLQKLAIIDVDSFRINIDALHLQHLITNHACCYFGDPEPRLILSWKCESIISADLCEVYVEVLNQVNNVRELRISNHSFPLIVQSLISLPAFPRLTNLELITGVDGKTMWIFLQRAPVLKSLVYDMRLMGNSLVPDNVPVCFADNLREIKLKNFKGGDAECAAVRYLLQQAAVVEKMTVKLSVSTEFRELPHSILKQLLEQRRLSPNCQIKFLEWNE